MSSPQTPWWVEITSRWKSHDNPLRWGPRKIARIANVPIPIAEQLQAFFRTGKIPETLEDPREVSTPGTKSKGMFHSVTEDTIDSVPPVILPNRSYEINEMTGAYIFAVAGVTRPVVLNRPTVEAMVRAYSKDGEGATINQMCRTFNLRRNVIVAVMRALGHTHDSLPFTAEEMAVRADEELVAEVRQLRQGQVYTKIEKEKWQDVKDDAQKWRRFQYSVLAELREFAQEPVRVAKVKLREADAPYTACLTPTDFHFGKYSDFWECGEEGNRRLSREKLIESTNRVLSRLAVYGRPEGIIVGVGSDWFNSDNDEGSTTKGTPQDNEGNPMEIVRDGTRLMCEYVDMLRQVAPVKLIGLAGNHDRMSGFALLLCLEARYQDHKDVEVHIESGSTRQYLQYGNSMIMFCHSDFVVKPKELANIAAAEQARMWGNTEHRVCFTGDKHHELVRDERGFMAYQLPSLSPADRWHSRSGYVGTRKTLAGVLIDKKDGVFATLYG